MADEAHIIERRSATVIAPATRHTIPSNDPFKGGRQIFWRVRARDDNSSSAWSGWCSFRTPVVAPQAAPSPLAPVCGSIWATRLPVVAWGPVEDAAVYRLQFAADVPDEAHVVDRRTATAAASQYATPGIDPFKPQRHVFWRVRAENEAGAGPWSGWCEFVTPAWEVPQPQSPGCGSAVGTLLPTVVWSAAGGADFYDVHFAADVADEAHIIERRSATVNATTTRHTIPSNDPFKGGRQIFWRVRARDDNSSSAWSGWCSFRTP